MKKAKKGRIGSGFDAFLKEEGAYEATQAVAIKRVLAWQIAQEMESQDITKKAMAERMQTSRSQLDRLLDPENDAVSLETLARAAHAVGRTLKLELS
jgi:antitoxin HicB